MNLIKNIEQSRMLNLIIKHRQRIVSIYVFINIAGFFVWNQYKNWNSISWGIVEITFMIHNLIMLALFLIRKNYKAIDTNIFHQLIASCAFFSGIAFSGQAQTGSEFAINSSIVIIFVSYVIGLFALVNLGTSFGVLIANRRIKTRGVYSIVRHPMYFTDILFRLGYVLSHINAFTVILLLLSSAAYIYRALLEEKFLSQDAEYADYMERVKYRFIPFIF